MSKENALSNNKPRPTITVPFSRHAVVKKSNDGFIAVLDTPVTYNRRGSFFSVNAADLGSSETSPLSAGDKVFLEGTVRAFADASLGLETKLDVIRPTSASLSEQQPTEQTQIRKPETKPSIPAYLKRAAA